MSSFYRDLDSYASIKRAVKVSVDQIRGVKSQTEEEKKSLEEKQNAEADAKFELENSEKKVKQSETEKRSFFL